MASSSASGTLAQMSGLPRGAVRVVLKGEGVAPETVDAREFLRLALEYFDALVHFSAAPLELNGLYIAHGSAVIASRASNLRVATAACRAIAEGLENPSSLSDDVAPRLDGFLKGLRRLPAGVSLRVRAGSFDQLLRPPKQVHTEHAWTVTSLRVRLVRVGGANPVARFESPIEGGFSCEVGDFEAAQRLAPHLYKDLDVVVKVQMDDDKIIRGELLEFEPLDQRDPVEALREWASEHRERWTDVTDVDGEIQRVRD